MKKNPTCTVTAQIENPQSIVRVYQEKAPGTHIIGWYHSHPSYSPFMSQTDFATQLRYQKLAKGAILTQPVALVIDHTEISNKNFGFKIFRADIRKVAITQIMK